MKVRVRQAAFQSGLGLLDALIAAVDDDAFWF